MQEATAVTPTTPTRPWPSMLLLLGVIVVLAAGLRLYDLGGQCFWTDEVGSVANASGHALLMNHLPHGELLDPPPATARAGADGSALGVWTRLGTESHPPLYFVLLHVWGGWFGSGDWAARMLSVLASVAGVALLFFAARMLHGDRVALWAALIMAVAPPQIQMAQEARAYALVIALGMGACLALVRLEKVGAGWPRAVCLALCTLGMVLSHYFTLGPALAIGVYVLLRLGGAARRQAIMALAAAAGIYLITWGPFLWQQRHTILQNNSWTVETAPTHRVLQIWNTLEVPARQLCEPPPGTTRLYALSAVLFVLPLALAARRKRPELLLWGLWLVASVAVVAIPDFLRAGTQLGFIRYTAVAGPAVFVMFAALVTPNLLRPPRPWLAHALPAVAALSCLLTLPSAWRQWKPDYRAVAAFYKSHANRGGGEVTLIVELGRPDDVDWFYATIDHYTDGFRGPVALLGGPAGPELLPRLREFSHIWVVLHDKQNSAGQVAGALADEFAIDQDFAVAADEEQDLQRGRVTGLMRIKTRSLPDERSR
jgi:uncharacterized membrane protein